MECHVGIMALIEDMLGSDSRKHGNKLHRPALELQIGRTDQMN